MTLCSCLPAVDLPPQSDEPALDPLAFFTGPSKGQGILNTITGGEQWVLVSSVGTPLADGSLSLRQRIVQGGELESDETTRDRTWIIRPISPGTYTGTLTEAIGPVEAKVRGNSMTIRYRTNDYTVHQRLVLGADGKLQNRLDVRKWGVKVATLRERIEKR